MKRTHPEDFAATFQAASGPKRLRSLAGLAALAAVLMTGMACGPHKNYLRPEMPYVKRIVVVVDVAPADVNLGYSRQNTNLGQALTNLSVRAIEQQVERRFRRVVRENEIRARAQDEFIKGLSKVFKADYKITTKDDGRCDLEVHLDMRKIAIESWSTDGDVGFSVDTDLSVVPCEGRGKALFTTTDFGQESIVRQGYVSYNATDLERSMRTSTNLMILSGLSERDIEDMLQDVIDKQMYDLSGAFMNEAGYVDGYAPEEPVEAESQDGVESDDDEDIEDEIAPRPRKLKKKKRKKKKKAPEPEYKPA